MTLFTKPRAISILAALTSILVASAAFAECKEFKIVEFDDRIEAVCIGEPMTAAQLKAKAEDEKRQEIENRRLKAETEKRQKEVEAATARSKSQEEADRKKQEVKPVPPVQKTVKSGNIFQKL